MRNPVGPLPSTIYWRRRVIALCVLALVALIVFWAVNSGGGGGGNGSGAPTGSHTPAATITAGPAPSGTHIGGRPGGRDTSPGGDGSPTGGSATGGTSGGGSGDTAGGGTAGSAGGNTGAGGTTAGAGSAAGASSGTTSGASAGGVAAGGGGTAGDSDGAGSGGQVLADPSLPDCASGAVRISLASEQNSYSPGDTPAFALRATNSGAITCKIDFGPTKAVFGITKAADNSHVWASNDCPTSGSHLLEVPAHSSTTYTLRWNGKTSSPKCAKPKGQQAAPGTYLIQATLAGYGSKQASFVLSQD
ncbi:hypothetical protein [Streptomyces sp. NBC_01190]|uniref:hypothetical protein n=1 Tax=Streptomyces sp. NBC_01190 TaxID=2903767 RepID=UPI00386FB10E